MSSIDSNMDLTERLIQHLLVKEYLLYGRLTVDYLYYMDEDKKYTLIQGLFATENHPNYNKVVEVHEEIISQFENDNGSGKYNIIIQLLNDSKEHYERLDDIRPMLLSNYDYNYVRIEDLPSRSPSPTPPPPPSPVSGSNKLCPR